MARDRLADNEAKDFVIRIIGPKNGDPPQYSLPTTDQLAMLVVGDFSCEEFERDIIVQKQTGDLDQISALHPAFMALQYPLLFPYVERGWQTGILYTGATQLAQNAHAKVDARACVDENRLKYIVDHQADIRMESIQGIYDAISRGSQEGSEVEISEAIFEPGQRPGDRNDIIVRVFNIKLEELLHDIRCGKPFGPCNAVLHTIEFQKRGLPHAHIILWTSRDTSDPTSTMIGKYVSAELPDPRNDPLGYALVAEHMIHGPCGKNNPRCPCMKNNKCSKHFPKPYQPTTTVNSIGFAVYKRPENNLFVCKGGLQMDNRWVVPYNMFLLTKYQAHINVEWCNKTTFIKYLFKYVTKGADCSKAYLQRVKRGQQAPYDDETQTINEIKEYLDCRYICEQDACWRMFGYDIHRHYPAVERMPVHLPNENFITFSARAKMNKLVSIEFLKRTRLTQWFVCNELFPEARALTYPEFPLKWIWDQRDRRWTKRKQQHVGDENTFFEKIWHHLADDIIYQYRDMIGDPNYVLPDSVARDYLLDELSTLFSQSGRNIADFNLPPKTHAEYPVQNNQLVEEELSYPSDPLIDMNNPTAFLNEDQRNAFYKIVHRVQQNEPSFFLYQDMGELVKHIYGIEQ
ncbi:uncharacterized protein [Miscanthus floridulus]|uniref:uncharacterized protein n=1 Tax=Miscanthus floridulus TaxID=154761 RepID=UPI00345A5F1B